MLKNHHKQYGFGVIEGIIIVLILLIIGTVVLAGYLSGKRDARDAQRVSDVVQIRKALSYYYQEFGQYPSAAGGKAIGADNTFSRFMSTWPNAPKPADGGCGDARNVYFYEQTDGGAGYQITFCLGSGYGNLNAGTHIITSTDPE